MSTLVEIGFVANTKGLQAADRDLKTLNKTGAQTDKTIGKVNKSMNFMGRSAGQAGIQLQQFIGQVQGGQSAMLALSQQGADLGIVLGAPMAGAIIGISSSIVGMLLPSLFKTKDAMQEVESLSKRLNESFATSSDGAVLLSEKIEKLAKTSKSLAQLQIMASLEDAEKQIKTTAEGIAKIAENLTPTTLQSGFGAMVDIFQTINKVGGDSSTIYKRLSEDLSGVADAANVAPVALAKLRDTIKSTAKEFKVSEESATKFIIAGNELANNTKNPVALKAFVSALTQINTESGGANKSIAKVANEIVSLSTSFDDGQKKANLLRMAFGEVTKTLNDSSETADKQNLAIKAITGSMTGQIIALRDGEEASLRYGVTQKLHLKDGEKLPVTIDRQISSFFQLRESIAQADAQKRQALTTEQAFESQMSKATLEYVKLTESTQTYAAAQVLATAATKNFSQEQITALTKIVTLNAKLRNDKNNEKSIIKDAKKEGKELDKLIDKVDNFGGAWSKTGSIIADTLGGIADGFDDYANQMSGIISLEQELKEKRDSFKENSKEREQATQALTNLEEKRTRAELRGLATIASTTSQLFDEQSKEREALHKAEQVFTAIEIGLALQKAAANALTAITSAFSAPFPVNFAAGAAMIGIMAGLGVFSGSGGGSAPSAASLQETQGTGTLMGSDEKSQSIVDALENYNDIGIDQLSQLIGIRQAMTSLSGGIAQLAVSLVSSSKFGGGEVQGLGTTKGYSGNSIASIGKLGGRLSGGLLENKLISAIGDPLGDMVDRFIGNFKKTTVDLLDTGINFNSQSLGDLIANGVMDATYYNVIKTTERSFWGLSKKIEEETTFTDIEAPIAEEFTRIFGFIGDTVQSSVDALGFGLTDGLMGPSFEGFANSIDDFMISMPNLSFEGMDGEQIQSELESIFSQQGDLLAQFVLPQITKYQQMGEGAFETLTRVAREQAIFNDSIEYMGLTLSNLSNVMRLDVGQAVIGLMGGIEEFSSATSSYVKNFFSDAEQTEMLGKSLTDVFSDLSLPISTTKKQFRDLVSALDLTDEADQKVFATLMSLNPALDNYIEALEKQKEALIDSANTAFELVSNAINLDKEDATGKYDTAKSDYEKEITRINSERADIEQKLVDSLSNATDSLTASFDAEKVTIQSLSDIRINGLNEELATIQSVQSERVSALNAEKSAISSSANSLLSLANKLNGVVGSSATTKQALDAAQRGDFSLAKSLNTNQTDESKFGSAIEFGLAKAIEKSRISAIAGLAGSEGDRQQQLLASIESSISSTNLAAQAQIDSINAQIELEKQNASEQITALDNQLNTLLGVDASVLSLEEATRAYQSAKLSLDTLNYNEQMLSLSAQEESAMALLDLAQLSYDAEIERLDLLLNESQSQLNATLNIDTSVMTVNESITNLGNVLLQIEASRVQNNTVTSEDEALKAKVDSTKIEENNALMLQSVMKSSAATAKYLKEMTNDGVYTR